MASPAFLKTLRRSIGNFVAISAGRVLGRTHVPTPRSAVCIETSQRCNLACRFCAYPKRGPGRYMPMADFRETVSQAINYGGKEIWLTPMLGEIFADPEWMQKLQILEDQPALEGFSFFTNFIMPSPDQIRALPQFRKLNALHISIYGHDAESFCKVTRKPQAQHDRLMANLRALAELPSTPGRQFEIHLSIRTFGGIRLATLPETELVTTLRTLRRERGATLMVSEDYDNWGGTVTGEDVAEIGTTLTDGRHIYMHGACHLLFCPPQVSAEGDVRACSCRDVDGSLTIGNIHDLPLDQLHAWSNPAFRKIVEDQQAGRFGMNCRTCSMYRSIYDVRSAAETARWPMISLDEARTNLSRP